MRTVVHLLRHGEVYNPDDVLYGRLPGFSLSDVGRQQALAVAETLSDHDLAHVVASPMERAQETAAPIAAAHQLDVAVDERLIEAANQFEGLCVNGGTLRNPRHWPKLWNPLLPSWGEPYRQIAQRMLTAVHSAREAAVGHEALCVSHQLPIWTLRLFLNGQRMWHDPRRRQCSLASLTSLVFEGERLIEIVYSEPAGGTDPTVTGA